MKKTHPYEGEKFMGFYEDLEKSLMEAIAIEKNKLPLHEVTDMPALTFRASESKREIDTEELKFYA